jgi:hypothetical protein
VEVSRDGGAGVMLPGSSLTVLTTDARGT